MAFLINRTAAARIECLHALTKFIYARFGKKSFSLSDIKFDREADNVHNYCNLLADSPIAGAYCRFKDNPLDEAGCSLTNGKNSDTTKSKEVSNTVNALHALGFVQRDGRSNHLTDFGITFATTDYESYEMTEIIKNAVLNYGPIVGVLNYLCENHKVGDTFRATELTVGYPTPDEYVSYKGNRVALSNGSKQDSNTRTKSCLLAWLTTAGYIKPARLKSDKTYIKHMAYRSYINSAQRGEQEYILEEIPEISKTEKPLDYKNLTKLNSGLREHGMSEVREATMYYENIVKNRRFAVIYLLNKAFQEKKELPLNLILSLFRKYPKLFVVSLDQLDEVIHEEVEIAYMVGIPYAIVYRGQNVYLKPIQGINMEEASIGAPDTLIDILKTVKIDG
jgi:hypothetical protein